MIPTHCFSRNSEHVKLLFTFLRDCVFLDLNYQAKMSLIMRRATINIVWTTLLIRIHSSTLGCILSAIHLAQSLVTVWPWALRSRSYLQGPSLFREEVQIQILDNSLELEDITKKKEFWILGELKEFEFWRYLARN